MSGATPGSYFGGVVISRVELQRWGSSTREIMTEVSGATLGSLGGRGRVGKMSKIKKKLH